MNKSEQEIEWLKEEISADETVEGTSDFSSFHAQRLKENREKLVELLNGYEES